MKLDTNVILFNAAGIGVLVTSLGYMAHSSMTTEAVPRCSKVYPAGQQFALEDQHGKRLSAISFQAVAGVREWGVIQNARVVAGSGDTHAPKSLLEVSFAPTNNEEKPDQNGVGFLWKVGAIQSAASVCLSYGVQFPDDFDFKQGGYLPGLFLAADLDHLSETQPPEGFQARMGWMSGGDLATEVRSSVTQSVWQGAKRPTRLQPGKWMMIEQEIRINTAGAADGLLRVWVNGKLALENTGMAYTAPSIRNFTGVLSEIGYAGSKGDPIKVRLSPYVVQWQ